MTESASTTTELPGVDRPRLASLLRAQALLTGDFTLASGGKSKYYFEKGFITTDPATMIPTTNAFSDAFLRHVAGDPGFATTPVPTPGVRPGGQRDGLFYNGKRVRIASPVLGAVPLAAMLSCDLYEFHDLYVPYLMVRAEAKAHGVTKMIEGKHDDGDAVILVEDVVTEGKTVVNAASVLGAAKLRVVHVMALLDRLRGGRKLIEKAGYGFTAILTWDDMGVTKE